MGEICAASLWRVNVRNPSGCNTAKTLWKMRYVKDRGDTYDDQTKATNFERVEEVRYGRIGGTSVWR